MPIKLLPIQSPTGQHLDHHNQPQVIQVKRERETMFPGKSVYRNQLLMLKILQTQMLVLTPK